MEPRTVSLRGYVPREVTDYAFDQMGDEVDEDEFSADYAMQTITLKTREASEVFANKVHEKLYDMLWEIRHGERSDYDRGYIEGLQSSVESLLPTDEKE